MRLSSRLDLGSVDLVRGAVGVLRAWDRGRVIVSTLYDNL